ncbi:MAG: hypothetical protein K0R18_1667 [Bacillales bacterium]|jgi:hypothetical protein|nr:hypothetical protein [Bacillales bacterium]
MNKLDLQETEKGWEYQLYVLGGEIFTSGHVDIKDLELAKDEIESRVYGNFELGQVVFLQERNV